ncbi:acyltransferase [Bacillus mobilis]|uniref:acyltransferase family protein n=1 Tax=Bacillus mobilis TaxID=2026190 RepID=UPI002E21767F|nr:acyltransferase [Bacillus mobilis]
MNQHYKELDSLRGVAALLVVITHLLLVFPIIDSHSSFQSDKLMFILKYSPIRSVFIGGSEAVKLFFVLSGFVLALPFLRKSKVEYMPYLVKRTFRIYIPYYFSIATAITLSLLLSSGKIDSLSNWYNRLSWVNPLDWDLLIGHILLIGDFNSGAYNNVIWSLVHEMRISIIFPLVMFFVVRYSFKINIAIFLPLSILGFNLGGYGDTLGYLVMFVIGALLAKNRMYFIEKYITLNKHKKIVYFLVGLLFYSLHAPGSISATGYFLVNILNSLGCSIIIIAALSNGIFTKFLLNKVINYLGKISYSLYLFHFIVLVACIKIFYGIMPMGVILALVFVISLIVSTISYYLIEIPSMKYGKRLARIISKETRQSLENKKVA